ncbi:MAG: extracellular solute-binding protein [Oscillospiraceae bacterium]|nr:extracellular solute-binding protein [Oscillospiraceae bacterium]
MEGTNHNICPNCGWNSPDPFCTKCGTAMAPQQPYTETPQFVEQPQFIVQQPPVAKPKKPIPKKLFLFGGGGLAVIIAAVLVILLVIVPGSRYKETAKLFDNGEYTQALTALEKLSDGYKDVKELRSYYEAYIAFDDQDFRLAARMFDDLGVFRDSGEMRDESNYRLAHQLINNRQYDEAYSLLSLLGDYKDSETQMLECRYLQAYDLIQTDAARAKGLFLELGNYNNAHEKLIECDYNIAVGLLDGKQYWDAFDLFESLGDFKDSEDMLLECSYRYAMDLYWDGDYEEAYSMFALLGNYKDSETMALSAFSAIPRETIHLRVMGMEGERAFLQRAIEEFKAVNPEINYEIELDTEYDYMGYHDHLMISILSGYGPDVFTFYDSQLREFVNSTLLHEVNENTAGIKSRNTPKSVDHSTLDGQLWAYPLTDDPGYFFYYDKSVLSEEDVKTLDGIINQCNAAGKLFTYPVGEPWIIASWLYAQGNTGIDGSGRVTCDFNNGNGVAAINAMLEMINSGAWALGQNFWTSDLIDGIGTIYAGGVGGVWMADEIKAKLGADFGVAKLPAAAIGGKQVQLSGFASNRVAGVGSYTRNAEAAMRFADFLTSEAMQILNAEINEYCPTNIGAVNSSAVQDDPVLAAMAEQAKFNFTERDVPDSYWSAVYDLCAVLINGDIYGNVQVYLDMTVAQLTDSW